MAFTDRELFARIIQCEAGGEGDDGMRAVATVIMNRVNDTAEYLRVAGGDIQKIIFQPGQFVCAFSTYNGAPNPRSIYTVSPEAIHFEIADWALGGGRLGTVGECLWFYNPGGNCGGNFPTRLGQYHTRVNQHCFYRPKNEYFNL